MDSEKIKEQLQKHGMKATMQRIVIYRTLLEAGNHPTADEIFNRLRKDYPSLSLSTIYNTLESFVDKNLLHKVHSDTSITRYDVIVEKHHHLYCDESREIADYHNPQLDALLDEFFATNEIPGFTINEVKLHIKGNFYKTKEDI